MRDTQPAPICQFAAYQANFSLYRFLRSHSQFPFVFFAAITCDVSNYCRLSTESQRRAHEVAAFYFNWRRNYVVRTELQWKIIFSLLRTGRNRRDFG
jgi:hypothetical protein